jgi:hypothetical protein
LKAGEEEEGWEEGEEEEGDDEGGGESGGGEEDAASRRADSSANARGVDMSSASGGSSRNEKEHKLEPTAALRKRAREELIGPFDSPVLNLRG